MLTTLGSILAIINCKLHCIIHWEYPPSFNLYFPALNSGHSNHLFYGGLEWGGGRWGCYRQGELNCFVVALTNVSCISHCFCHLLSAITVAFPCRPLFQQFDIDHFLILEKINSFHLFFPSLWLQLCLQFNA
jgi:hypothetical protein